MLHTRDHKHTPSCVHSETHTKLGMEIEQFKSGFAMKSWACLRELGLSVRFKI